MSDEKRSQEGAGAQSEARPGGAESKASGGGPEGAVKAEPASEDLVTASLWAAGGAKSAPSGTDRTQPRGGSRMRYGLLAVAAAIAALVLAVGLPLYADSALDAVQAVSWGRGALIAVIVIAALLIGAAGPAALRAARARPDHRRMDVTPPSAAVPPAPSRQLGWNRRWSVAAVVIAGAVLLLVTGTWFGTLSPTAAVLMLVCGSVAVVAALFAIESVARGEGLQFDSHWGGLGGGMGGWRISPTTSLVLIALVFLLATFVAAAFALKNPEPDPLPGSQPKSGASAPVAPVRAAPQAPAAAVNAAAPRSAAAASAGNEAAPAPPQPVENAAQ